MAKKHEESAIYSPYGAYELKAKYQKNFLYGTGLTAGFVLLILTTFWVIAAFGEEEAISDNVHIIKTVAELGPPPSIAKTKPQIKVDQPNVAAPKVGIPKPVADDEILDDDVTLATRDELAEIVAPDITASSGDGDIVVDIDEDDYLPGMDDFVAVETQPEMVFNKPADYPRLAKQAGIEGTVWVKALIKRDGSVQDAVVYKSSGNESLDIAAVEAAFDNKYKPAIQNGRPVAIWIAYRVDFKLTDG